MIDYRHSDETSDFLRSIIDGAPYGIIALASNGTIRIANEQAMLLLDTQTKASEYINQDASLALVRWSSLRSAILDSLNHNSQGFDIEDVMLNGRHLAFRGRPIHRGLMVTIADISTIKESEINALNSLLEGQEQERKRLAREIHDGIGPILSTVKINLAGIEDDVETINHSLGEKFRKTNKMIDEAANELRAISHNLMPKLLSDFGLVEALETLCEKINDSKSPNIQFIHSGIKHRLDEGTELALYRISQELINNTLKHAQASKITLQVLQKQAHIQLMYEDDGVGFRQAKKTQGLGLTNIENRTKALSGEVIVDSRPGKGMTATIEIPLNGSKS